MMMPRLDKGKSSVGTVLGGDLGAGWCRIGAFGYSTIAWGRVMSLPLAHTATVLLKKVTDTEAAPFRYICQVAVTVGISDIEIATGVLVGPKHVLTAAHPLVDGGSLVKPDQITVIPGVNGIDAPFGASSAINIITPKGFSPGDEVTVNDFALIETEEDFSKLGAGAGFWGTSRQTFDDKGSVVGAIPGWRPGHFKVNISGYPFSKGRDTQWHSYDDTINLSQFELSGLSSSEQTRFLFFKNAIEQGMSGSPIWVSRHHSLGGRFDFAIVLGMKEINGKRYAAGRVIDRELKEFIARHTKTKLRTVGHEIEFGGEISKGNYPFWDGTRLEFEAFNNKESFEKEASCPIPCPSPPPPKGEFSAPDDKGHRWFTPEYNQYPNNSWHLAKVVHDRMLADRNFKERGVPTENQIRYGITAHPCNRHFTSGKPMFMPRFGANRCTGSGSYFGSIYIPFRFDGKKTPFSPDTVFSLDSSLNWNMPGVNELQYLLYQCNKTVAPVLPGDDDRVPVSDTRRLPHRWICAIFTIFPKGPGNPKPTASRSSGFLLDNRHLVTSAHVLYKFSKHDPGFVQIPESIIFIPGFDPGLNNSAPFGAFTVIRKSGASASSFYVPSEWIMSIPPEGRFGDPKFDYGIIDISKKKSLSSGNLEDSWTTVNPILASVAARNEPEPEGIAKLILSTGSKGFHTAGYPADKTCIPMETAEFEFTAFHLPINSSHNVMVHRADTFFGASGSPVWLERKVSGKKSGVTKTQRLLIGIVQGARETRFGSGVLVTYSTVITPKVFERLRHPSFLSAV